MIKRQVYLLVGVTVKRYSADLSPIEKKEEGESSVRLWEPKILQLNLSTLILLLPHPVLKRQSLFCIQRTLWSHACKCAAQSSQEELLAGHLFPIHWSDTSKTDPDYHSSGKKSIFTDSVPPIFENWFCSPSCRSVVSVSASLSAVQL